MFKLAAVALACATFGAAAQITTQYYQVLGADGNPICDSRNGGCAAYASEIDVYQPTEVGAAVTMIGNSIRYQAGDYVNRVSVSNGLTENAVQYFYERTATVNSGSYKWTGGNGPLTVYWILTGLLDVGGDLTPANFSADTGDFPCCGDRDGLVFRELTTFDSPFRARVSTNLTLYLYVSPNDTQSGYVNAFVAGYAGKFEQNGIDISDQVRLVAVPEPGSFLLLTAPLLLLLCKRKASPNRLLP